MTQQLGLSMRNAIATVYGTSLGATPILRFYTGSQPADCATAASGTLIALGSLPATYLNAAAAGAVTKAGTWTVTGQAAASTGTVAGYFRLYDSTGTTCHEQGSITVTGGGGDLTVDNASVANAQVVTVTAWTRTAGGA